MDSKTAMPAMAHMQRKPEPDPTAKSGETLASRPSYPFGLQITLDDEELDKLGIDTLPKVGSSLQLTAKVTVSRGSESASQNEEGKADKQRSLGLQITHLALAGGGITPPAAKKPAPVNPDARYPTTTVK